MGGWCLKEPLCRGGGLGGCRRRGLESWRGAEKVFNSIELVSASWSCGSAGEHRPEPGTKAEPPRSWGGSTVTPPREELELRSVAEPCPWPGAGALGRAGVLEAPFGAEPHVTREDKSCRQRQVRVCRWFRGSPLPGSRPAVRSQRCSFSQQVPRHPKPGLRCSNKVPEASHRFAQFGTCQPGARSRSWTEPLHPAGPCWPSNAQFGARQARPLGKNTELVVFWLPIASGVCWSLGVRHPPGLVQGWFWWRLGRLVRGTGGGEGSPGWQQVLPCCTSGLARSSAAPACCSQAADVRVRWNVELGEAELIPEPRGSPGDPLWVPAQEGSPQLPGQEGKGDTQQHLPQLSARCTGKMPNLGVLLGRAWPCPGAAQPHCPPAASSPGGRGRCSRQAAGHLLLVAPAGHRRQVPLPPSPCVCQRNLLLWWFSIFFFFFPLDQLCCTICSVAGAAFPVVSGDEVGCTPVPSAHSVRPGPWAGTGKPEGYSSRLC